MNKDEIRHSIECHAKVAFSRASGPGGQNVNKVNTRVTASIRLEDIAGITPRERAQLSIRFGTPSCNNSAGETGGKGEASGTEGENIRISVNVQDERFQALNRTIAFTRLAEKIERAAYIQKKRHPTRPTKASKERRLKSKSLRSEVKRNRHRPTQSG